MKQPAVRALISVTDKEGIVPFATALAELGIELISTGRTASMLRDAGLSVVEVGDYTQFPEMMDGRVKTLHPRIHGGILALRDNADHVAAMNAHNILPIDIVVVNLYPFEKTVAKPNCPLDEAVENIDIGGPSLIRGAAKNWRHVAVVTDPSDYMPLVDELKRLNRCVSDETLFALMRKAFTRTAAYDAAIATHLNRTTHHGEISAFSDVLATVMSKRQDLRYGENPHQQAAFYVDASVKELSVSTAKQLHGKELSYNNILDANGAIELAKELADHPAAVIVKHTNPCGVAVSTSSIQEAYERALATDSKSAFGGIVCLTREVDEGTAGLIATMFYEMVIAPSYDPQAMAILTQKKNIRLLELAGLDRLHMRAGRELRQVVGGMLVQDRDLNILDLNQAKVVTHRKPTDDEWKALALAWKVAKHVKSNAIVLSGADQIAGVGAGQMSRVDAAKVASMKRDENGLRPNPLVVASDAFYPFRDGIDQCAAVGATAVIQPGGSIRDEEVIAAANEHNMAMVFTGIRHFKH